MDYAYSRSMKSTLCQRGSYAASASPLYSIATHRCRITRNEDMSFLQETLRSSIWTVLMTGLCWTCPPGWDQHGGSCYFRSSVAVNFTEARCVCAGLQAVLLQVNSPEESAYLDLSVANTLEPYWLGTTDLRDNVYVWEDGTSTDHLDWYSNQPDSHDRDHCGVYLKDLNIWGIDYIYEKHFGLDTSCDFWARPYCERPVTDLSSAQRVLNYRGRDVLYPDHTIMEVKVDSPLHCYSACALNCRCFSFSACVETRRCLLYDRYANQLGGTKRYETGCKLYD